MDVKVVDQAGARAQQDWAHDVTGWAIRHGYLVKSEDCEHCGWVPGPDEYLHGHHWLGYEWHVALVVEWLCTSCHSSAHGRGVPTSMMTPEARAERSRKIWATRKQRYGPTGQKDATLAQRGEHQQTAWATRRARYGPTGRKPS